jgi:hypothetical protein
VLNRVFFVSLELVCWILAFVGFVVAGWIEKWSLARENGERSCSEQKDDISMVLVSLCETFLLVLDLSWILV